MSVSSQSDAERADPARETAELLDNLPFEQEELAQIYVKRGVHQDLARRVADQLMGKDALGAHARDELGISDVTTARSVQAALTLTATFAVGAAMPLHMVLVSPARFLIPNVSIASLVFLALLGAVGARAGGANLMKATARVTFWGVLAMAATAFIGKFFGAAIQPVVVAAVVRREIVLCYDGAAAYTIPASKRSSSSRHQYQTRCSPCEGWRHAPRRTSGLDRRKQAELGRLGRQPLN